LERQAAEEQQIGEWPKDQLYEKPTEKVSKIGFFPDMLSWDDLCVSILRINRVNR
jgi:hypothetical protein